MLSFSFLRVNFQFTLLRPRIMQDGAPLITLVKKGELAERPSLSSEDLALERTLSMLCSFLSVDDFVSFLNSLAFASYAQREEHWVVFEIGLYHDHTKTLQLYPGSGRLTIADEAMTGVFEEHLWKGEPNEAFANAITRWIGVVSNLQ